MIGAVFLALLGGGVEELQAEYAVSLVERGEAALEARLFLDAERCLLEAREWSPDTPGVSDLLERLDEGRRATLGEANEGYEAFLSSRHYRRARALHAEVLDQLREDTSRAALKLAGGAKGEPAEAALRMALELGANERDCKRAVGRTNYQAWREAWEVSRGIGQLSLGARLSGAPLADDALEGRVVVWRSFSL